MQLKLQISFDGFEQQCMHLPDSVSDSHNMSDIAVHYRQLIFVPYYSCHVM